MALITKQEQKSANNNLKDSQKFIQQVRTSVGYFKRQILRQYHSLFKTQVVSIKGIKIEIGSHVSEKIRNIIYQGDYEGAEFRILKSQLYSDDVVMEIGTGLGFLSSYCAKKLGNHKVFTYEANPALEVHIRKNYKLNGVNPTFENCLIGEYNGEETFYVYKDFWMSSIVKYNEDAQAVKIPVKSFQETIEKINPTFLIIDIEGGEYEFLKYANFYNVQKILIEIHIHSIGVEKSNFVKNKLAEAGFQINDNLSFNQEFYFERLK